MIPWIYANIDTIIDCYSEAEEVGAMSKCELCRNKSICVDSMAFRDGCKRNGYDAYLPPSNADVLRSMSDEDLATWLNTMQSNAWHSGRMMKTPNKYPSTNQAWREWLRKEVDA